MSQSAKVTPAVPVRPPSRAGSIAGGIIMLVAGVLIALIGLGMTLAGSVMLAIAARPNSDGYFMSPTRTVSADSYAITSLEWASDDMRGGGGMIPAQVAQLRLTAEPTDSAGSIFIGIATEEDIDRYLDGVHYTVLDSGGPMGRLGYRDVPGTQTPTAPADETFWIASVSGSGEQQLDTEIPVEPWAVVVMNEDASADISVRASVGLRSDLFGPVAGWILGIGILLLLGGIALIVGGVLLLGRRAGGTGVRPTAVTGGAVPGTAAAAGPGVQGPNVMAADDGTPPGAYPARLEGVLAPPLSRWLWLVKWILLIPHFIVLFFLFIGFLVASIIAFFAILFTGRYPRALFDFNVGVMRWSWRVGFYGYSALGTDQYPPFTLAQTNYPADFTVDYPERLSRGLVLVKWWLLAIPHYLVVGAFTTGLWTWWSRGRRWDGAWTGDYARATGEYARATGPSLLLILVLIAAVILLFKAAYPEGLFRLVMGLNRWSYRVMAYAGLMTDTYPPFRLDQGGREVQPGVSAPIPS